MKILMLNYEFPPLGGGAGRATYNIARQLSAAGHKVDVLTSNLPKNSLDIDVEPFRIFQAFSIRKGIHDCGFRGAISYVLFAIPQFYRLTKKNNYDAIHCFFSMPTGLLTLLPGKHRKIPCIVSLRGSDVPGYDPYNRSLQLIHRCLRPVTRRIWKQCDQVVALSSSLRETALKTLNTLPIDIIPNGVESDLFTAKSCYKRNNDGKFKLVLTARLIERKGIQHVLAALARLSDKSISLTIVGEGNYENELRTLTEDLQLGDQVNFHGYCPREHLPKILKEHDAFILTSMAESFGLVFVEAMACGLPVIAGRTGGVTNIIQENNGILVNPGDIEKIAEAILSYQANAPLCEQIGRENRRTVEARYNWQSVSQQYLKTYCSAPS